MKSRTFVCLSGAWMGGWTWQFVAEKLRAAGHVVHAPSFRGVAERAAELSPDIGNESCAEDALACLRDNDLRDVVLVGHSFGSLIAQIAVDRDPSRVAHLVIIDGGIAQDGQSIFGAIEHETWAYLLASESVCSAAGSWDALKSGGQVYR